MSTNEQHTWVTTAFNVEVRKAPVIRDRTTGAVLAPAGSTVDVDPSGKTGISGIDPSGQAGIFGIEPSGMAVCMYILFG
jgi:hypothetical protein